MKQHASQATKKKPNQKKSRSDSIGESGDVSILGMPITGGKTPANLVFSMEPEEEWGRDPSMWVYKSDPDFEKKTFILNGEPFDVELGLRMRKCCDAWDHIPDEELMYGDDAVGDRESLKDIYFIGLDKTFVVRVVWPDDTEKFPFPREISISSPSNPAVIPCAECAVYGQILMGDGTNLKIRGYHFFNTSPEDCGVIETKTRKRKGCTSNPLSAHDMELYEKFQRMIPCDSDTLDFIRNHCWSDSYRSTMLKPFYRFRETWQSKAFEFDNQKINLSFNHLKMANEEFLSAVAKHVGPHKNCADRYSINYDDADPTESQTIAMNTLNALSDKWYAAHESFIELFRSECASLTNAGAVEPEQKKASSIHKTSTAETTGGPQPGATENIDVSAIPREELQTAVNTIFFMLSQAYYTIIQLTVGNQLSYCDVTLNQYYLCILNDIRSLLKTELLHDFPKTFEPPFEDLMPSTIENIDWDMVAYKMDDFLATVQQYIFDKSGAIPAKDSAAQQMIDAVKVNITKAIECAKTHKNKLDEAWSRMHPEKTTPTPQKAEVSPKTSQTPSTETPCSKPNWFAITKDYTTCNMRVAQIPTEEGYDRITDDNALCADGLTPKLQINLLGCKLNGEHHIAAVQITAGVLEKCVFTGDDMFRIYIRLFLIKGEAPERWEYSGHENIIVCEYTFSAMGKEAELCRKGCLSITFPVVIDERFKQNSLSRLRAATADESVEVLKLYDATPAEKAIQAPTPVIDDSKNNTSNDAPPSSDIFQETWPDGPLRCFVRNKSLFYKEVYYEIRGEITWKVLLKLAEGKGGFVSFTEKNIKSLFQRGDAAKFSKYIVAKGKGRNGDGSYKLES